MKILALETSTEHCSVALWHEGGLDSLHEHVGQRHSQRLLPMVDELLGRHGLGVKELDGIAFGQGPGSFTGLRIACGVTQGLAFGAGLPVVGVGTLAALAAAAQAERTLCCMDARMGEIYHAAYARTGAGLRAALEPGLYPPEAAPALPEGDWTGCGSGFTVHGEALRRRYGKRLSAIMPDLFPHAREIARLAVPEFEAGRTVSAEQAVPVYVRDKVALKTAER